MVRVRFLVKLRDLSLLYSVQTTCEAYQASALSSGLQRLGSKGDTTIYY
jgi:hypothetical protein